MGVSRSPVSEAASRPHLPGQVLASVNSWDTVAAYVLGAALYPLPLCYGLSYVFPEATQLFHDAVLEPVFMTQSTTMDGWSVVLASAPAPVTVSLLAALDLVLAARYLHQRRARIPLATLMRPPSSRVVCCVALSFAVFVALGATLRTTATSILLAVAIAARKTTKKEKAA